MRVDDIPAGRELDALVAEKVMGWLVRGYESWDTKDGLRTWGLTSFGSFQPSTDIKAAFEVAEQVEADGWHMRLAGPKCRNNEGKIIDGHDALFLDLRSKRLPAQAVAETEALAICRAALKAVGVTEVPDEGREPA